MSPSRRSREPNHGLGASPYPTRAGCPCHAEPRGAVNLTASRAQIAARSVLDNIFAPIFLPIPASGSCLGAKVIPRRDQEGQEGRKGGFDPHREVPRSAISKPRNPPPEAISRRGAFTIRPLANPISVSSLTVSADICFVSFVCFVGPSGSCLCVREKWMHNRKQEGRE